MASAKKRQDGEVTQKIKEREMDANAHKDDVSSFYSASHLQEKNFREDCENGDNRSFENFSDSHSNSDAASKKDESLDDGESGDDANPLASDRPSSGASAENEDTDVEKTNRHFKSLIYGVCKARNERLEQTPGSYTSQFSMCSGNMIPNSRMPHFNPGMLSAGKNSSSTSVCTLGNRSIGGSQLTNMYGTNSPVVGPISMDSLFGGTSMLQTGIVGDPDLQKF